MFYRVVTTVLEGIQLLYAENGNFFFRMDRAVQYTVQGELIGIGRAKNGLTDRAVFLDGGCGRNHSLDVLAYCRHLANTIERLYAAATDGSTTRGAWRCGLFTNYSGPYC